MSRLLVIVPDYISAIVAKGEYQPRYYNPGNLFDEVHILMTNADQVNPQDIQHTIGTARLYLHNVPIEETNYIRKSRLFKPWLLKSWARPFLAVARKLMLVKLDHLSRPAVELASQIKPDLIRCHGIDYNTYIAYLVRRKLGIPYLVSLHCNPDTDTYRRSLNPDDTWDNLLFAIYFYDIEEVSLRNADLALPVYKDIIPYIKRLGCKNYEVAYNVLNGDNLTMKESYTLHHPIQVISVGRHFEYKNPENIIYAIEELPEVHFTLVGDGPLQEHLESIAKNRKLESRVTFHRSVPNDNLCKMLPEFDIFAVHNEYFGISKSQIEALLTGMPCIANNKSRLGQPISELQGDFILRVENTKEGYYEALQQLISDDGFREQLGKKAFRYSQDHWSPSITESKYVEIYKRFMAN